VDKISQARIAEKEMKLTISPAPHLRAKEDVQRIMFYVIVALTPATLGSLYFFKLYALRAILISIVAAVLTEAGIQKLRKIPLTINDLSAVVTGLLLALTLPPKVPWWIPLVGGFVAISLGKQVFGGLGYNIFNPALVARAVLLLSWPAHISRDWYSYPKIDTVTQATPLYLAKQAREGLIHFEPSRYYKLFLFGNPSGTIGEISVLLLLAGAVFLFLYRVIDWQIPISYLATVAVLTMLLGSDPIFYLLAGGLVLGAFFMATDYVTAPVTKKGQIIFGIGCGLVTVLLRFYAGPPEAVMYSILFMNACTSLIDRYTKPRVFGVKDR